MITFDWPQLFYLLPLPLLVYWFVPEKKRQQTPLFMPFLHHRHIDSSNIAAGSNNKLSLLLLLCIWLLLICAAAKPVKVGEIVELPANGRDVLLAVDISGSMKIKDMELNNREVNRLTAVKHVVNNFIEERKGDRLGLILFGSNAYIQSPLTFDLKTVATLLNEAEIGFAGQETAIGEAIGLAIKRLANQEEGDRVLILLTDGQNTAGSVDPVKAAQLAKEQNVTIYTVGMGSDKTIRRGFFGMSSYNPSRDLDEKTLKTIADITQGRYFRARNPKELNDIYETINQLEAIEQEPEIFRPQQAVFYWPLGAAMLLCLLHILATRLATMFGGYNSRAGTIRGTGNG